LEEQDEKSRSADPEMTENRHFVKELAFPTKRALRKRRSVGVQPVDERSLGTQETLERRNEQSQN
jgi:hypothetical protein